MRQSVVVRPNSPARIQHDRQSLWKYYDRWAAEGVRGLANAHAYWTGLGLPVDTGEIAAEAAEVERRLRSLDPTTFIEVGCGPGTFTSMLAGTGVALDRVTRRCVGSDRNGPRFLSCGLTAGACR